MLTVQQMNEKLASLYLGNMGRMLDLINSNKDLSDPLLLSVDERYCKTKKKIMVVGQETNGWEFEAKYDQGPNPEWPIMLSSSEYIELLMKRYQNKHWNKVFRDSPFWKAADLMYDKLNNDSEKPDIGYLWNNFDKVDNNRKALTPELRRAVHDCFFVLWDEIEITKPEVVIFFTGDRYDKHMEEMGCKITSLQAETGVKFDWLARVHADALPPLSFVLSHPRQIQMNQQWEPLNKLIKFINKITE